MHIPSALMPIIQNVTACREVGHVEYMVKNYIKSTIILAANVGQKKHKWVIEHSNNNII